MNDPTGKKIIKRYQVQHPLLKRYIKFIWEIQDDNVCINRKIIPLRNIDLRFNLGDASFYISENNKNHLLGKVFFSGLSDQFKDASMKITGKVHLLGVCFHPEGFYPFSRIPASEFKNHILDASEAGLCLFKSIHNKLMDARDIKIRIFK